MAVDSFSEISAKRFEVMTENQVGHRVLLFPYLNVDKDLPSPLVGLWLSNEIVRKQIESAHSMPDNECRRVLTRSGAYLPGSVSVWTGLEIVFNNVEGEQRAHLHLPTDFVEDYQRFAIKKELPIVDELQERFSIAITVL